ncbi:MAG: hypothetical protein U9R19_17880 [Bacteroidota bacterium]|nr:hypothetical protein [Bacteroidota bacterium]
MQNFKHLDLRYLKKTSLGKKEIEKNMLELFILQLNKFSKEMKLLFDEKKWHLLGNHAFFAKEILPVYGLKQMALDLNQLVTLCNKYGKNENPAMGSNISLPSDLNIENTYSADLNEITDIMNNFILVTKETTEEIKIALEEYT